MKIKRLSLALLFAFGLVSSALAEPNFRPPHFPGARTVAIHGSGVGGSHKGDQYGACMRAKERARQDALQDCARYRGYVLNLWAGDCRCSHRGREINCRANAHGSCRISYHWGASLDQPLDLNQDITDLDAPDEVSEELILNED